MAGRRGGTKGREKKRTEKKGRKGMKGREKREGRLRTHKSFQKSAPVSVAVTE